MYNQIASNKWKSYAIFLLFFLVIAVLAWLVIYAFGGVGGAFSIGAAGAIAIILALANYFLCDKIALAQARARPATREEYPHYVNSVEGLAIAAGIPAPKTYVIESDAINAFATGRNPKNAAIAVTTGALKKLNRVELEGVIAHEISHIKNYDIRLVTIAIVMVGFVAILSDLFMRGLWWGAGRRDEDRGNAGTVIIIVGMAFAILAPIAVQLLHLALSRKREYLADATGAMLTRYPEGLASALEKIGRDTKQLESASEATAPMYIANPFKNISLSKLLSTHPPLEDRIARLRKM